MLHHSLTCLIYISKSCIGFSLALGHNHSSHILSDCLEIRAKIIIRYALDEYDQPAACDPYAFIDVFTKD